MPCGSRGTKRSRSSWSRNPPKPQTSAIQAPASEAMCRPSSVSPFPVLEVDQRRLAQVRVGKIEVADLGRQHGLAGCRQGEVANGQPLGVRERRRLLGEREPFPEPLQGQHQVGLLGHLLAVQVEVRHVAVQQVRVLLGGRSEVPALP